MEQRTMTLLMAPKPAVMQKVAQARILAEKARQKAIAEGRAPSATTAKEDEIEKLEQELEARDEGDEDDEDDEA
jgi:translation initiation factor IF-3